MLPFPRLRPLFAAPAVALLLAACSSGTSDPAAGTADAPAAVATSTPTTTDPGAEVPPADWEVVSPAEAEVDEGLLGEALGYAFTEDLHTQGVVVIRGGRLIAERYAPGRDEHSWAASWSMAKSLTSALVGIAIEDGLIPSVDEPMTTWIPSWEGSDKAGITLRHVLQMSSGLAWNEDYDPENGASDIIEMVLTADPALDHATSRPVAAPPGTVFNYSSGDTMLLSAVLQGATGRTVGEYAREVLFDPIGIGPVDWWVGTDGRSLTYCCVDMTSRDFARVGQLFLQEGRWGDRQVVPEAWVRDSLTPSPAEVGYGYQWWLSSENTPEEIPRDTFRAQGFDGQMIYVVPSLDLVVVRNGTYVKSEGDPVADPTLFSHYPPANLVEGRGTRPPEGDWDHARFLGTIVDAAGG